MNGISKMAVVAALAILAIVAVAAFRLGPSFFAASAQTPPSAAAFVPDPHNSNSITVRGWNRDELDRMIGDFRISYGLPDSAFRIFGGTDGVFTIAFPQDIQPGYFYFLVNYINYPRNFDLKHRAPIGAVGHAVLSAASGAPDASFIGKHATFYVPADDHDYDLVYARLESGVAYKIAFTDMKWQPVSDPRVPDVVKGP